jgi:putative restriction endonuclease
MKGLMGVGDNYEVIVSKRVRMDQNNPGHIFTLEDRQIFRPDEQFYWPSQENIGWHRNYAFRK